MKSPLRYILALTLTLVALVSPTPVRADTAVIPVAFDYDLLRALLVQRHFTDPDESAVALDKGGGCRRVVLSHPRLTPLGWALRTTADVTVRTGLVMFGKCVSPEV
ncbi:MAG: hypothetical protein HQK87_08970, partial [Nitrospinae bacterium]|nr:hypothetical protein [Nitrospinota bacterium]